MAKNKKHTERFKNFNLIVFGGSGDLALRKIFPAVFHRIIDGQLLCEYNIIAVSRKEGIEEEFKRQLNEFVTQSLPQEQIDQKQVQAFISKIKVIYAKNASPEGYTGLKKYISKFKEYQNIYYFSTPSSAFGPISEALKSSGLVCADSKVVLEKPLGDSLKSSIEINALITKTFSEGQIYRIDHYLGKETVQNLMVLRFANNLFERAWDSENIESIQITVAESLGIENRAGYYDKSGALLDMVQNHLLQLLCLVAMEPPFVLNADEVRNEKLKVLRSLRPFNKNSILTDSIKGQYTRGTIEDKEVSSYLEDISKYESKTETFVALKTYVDNWRWKNVPFYLRTGKRMRKRYSEIVINFKEVRHNLFPSKEKINNNKLIIRLQPEERIELIQMTKIPGPGGYRYKPIALKLDYLDSFDERFPEAYERLIIDIIRGNQTLFMSQDELIAAWTWIETITANWQQAKLNNILYEAGSWGPGDPILEKHESWVTKTWKK